jgi:serine/threonine protein kinase
MGEVYRASDPELGREVAVKVLPAEFSTDSERLRRFEREARAASALNHPGLLTIFDVGTHAGAPYLISELLEGETLRDRLQHGRLPVDRAVDFAIQLAKGLAAAHAKGIVHRDLKPENLFVCKDGRIKILDFGLAKVTLPRPIVTDASTASTLASETESGVIFGTVGYMSPEQLRGEPADSRSDLFAFGAVLYEMLMGRRAFAESSPVGTMSAILHAEPAGLADGNAEVPPALLGLVRHCLEKHPDERFQSARDLAFQLQALSDLPALSKAVEHASGSSKRRFLLPAGIAVLAVASLVAGKRLWDKPPPTPPSFRQLTFRRGTVFSARFAPDGHVITYAAAFEGKPIEVFSTRREFPESRSLGMPATHLLSMSSQGEMAISRATRYLYQLAIIGTFARVPLAGGAPRDVMQDVREVDWAPDGSAFAAVHQVGEECRLEYPPGRVLYETRGWISHARFSPKGDLIAFLDHPAEPDDRGSIEVVDLNGKARVLSAGWVALEGVAWFPGRDEGWFSGSKAGVGLAIHAVTLDGHERLALRAAGRLLLFDISTTGDLLVARDSERVGIIGQALGDTREHELSWMDQSDLADISADGRTLLFTEYGEAAGPNYAVCLRKMDGSDVIRLGEGAAVSLSPDGSSALEMLLTDPVELRILRTGAGETQKLDRHGIEDYYFPSASFLPDGRRVLFMANEPGQPKRGYVQDITGGAPRAVTPDGIKIYTSAVSPDGKRVAGVDEKGSMVVCPLDGGLPLPVQGAAPNEVPIRWSQDGRSLYVYRTDELPARIFRLDVVSGRRELWKEIIPADPAGLLKIQKIVLPPEGQAYAYCYYRDLSELYLVEGVK